MLMDQTCVEVHRATQEKSARKITLQTHHLKALFILLSRLCFLLIQTCISYIIALFHKVMFSKVSNVILYGHTFCSVKINAYL